MLTRLIGKPRFVQSLWLAAACLALPSVAAASGLPQLNANSFPTQLFWLALSFILLYLVMSRIALPGVASVIDARARKIDGDLQAAAEAKSNAKAALEAYDQALIAARHQGQAIMKSVTEQIALEHSSREQELGHRLAAQNAEAGARISAASTAALANLHQVAAEAAVVAVHRLTGLSVSHSEASAVVDRLLEERR